MSSTHECNLSDAVVIHHESLCNWCRQPVTTAEMGRTGQAICCGCVQILMKLFKKNEEDNRPVVNGFLWQNDGQGRLF
jgi:hypothetical protein